MDLSKENMKRIMILIAFAVAIFVGFENVNVVIHTVKRIIKLLSPFILGGSIAFIMNVPMRVIERSLFRSDKLKRVGRPISILLTLIFILGLIFIATFVIFPEFTKTLGSLFVTIPGYAEKLQNDIIDLVKKYPELQEYVASIEIDWNSLGNNIINFTKSLTGNIFNSTIGFLGSVVSGITNFIIGFVFAIYILSQKEKLSKQGKKLLYAYLPEKKAERVTYIMALTENTFANFLSGQCIEAIILGCMFFVTMTIFRFPYALLVGVMIAFTALIPIFGAFIGCVVGAFLILMVNPIQALWFILLFLVLQQIEGNLIYPHVVGGSVGLPSIWVLFAVTIGGNLMGIFGMLIFIPISSVLYALMRTEVNKRIRRREITKDKLDPKPFREHKEEQKREVDSVSNHFSEDKSKYVQNFENNKNKINSDKITDDKKIYNNESYSKNLDSRETGKKNIFNQDIDKKNIFNNDLSNKNFDKSFSTSKSQIKSGQDKVEKPQFKNTNVKNSNNKNTTRYSKEKYKEVNTNVKKEVNNERNKDVNKESNKVSNERSNERSKVVNNERKEVQKEINNEIKGNLTKIDK